MARKKIEKVATTEKRCEAEVVKSNWQTFDLTPKEFYERACHLYQGKGSVDWHRAQDWWNAFVEVMVREIYCRGRVRLPIIGLFETNHIDAKYVQHTNKETGEVNYYYAPEHILPKFKPTDTFIDDINMAGVTQGYKAKLKTGTLSIRDYQRMLRADTIKIFEEGMGARETQTLNNFDDFLEQKKQNAAKEFEKWQKKKQEGNEV